MTEPIAKGADWRLEHDWGKEFFCEPSWTALGNKLRKLAELCELSALAKAATEAAEALEKQDG